MTPIDYLAERVGSRTVAWLVALGAATQVATILICMGLYLKVTTLADSNERTGDQLVQSVCTLRADYTRRIVETRAFLRANPNGLQLANGQSVTAASLRLNITNMRRTRAALAPVNCDGVHVPEIVTPPVLSDGGASGGS